MLYYIRLLCSIQYQKIWVFNLIASCELHKNIKYSLKTAILFKIWFNIWTIILIFSDTWARCRFLMSANVYHWLMSSTHPMSIWYIGPSSSTNLDFVFPVWCYFIGHPPPWYPRFLLPHSRWILPSRLRFCQCLIPIINNKERERVFRQHLEQAYMYDPHIHVYIYSKS